MVTPPPALVSSSLPPLEQLEHSGLSSRNNEEVASTRTITSNQQHTSDVTILSPRGSYDNLWTS